MYTEVYLKYVFWFFALFVLFCFWLVACFWLLRQSFFVQPGCPATHRNTPTSTSGPGYKYGSSHQAEVSIFNVSLPYINSQSQLWIVLLHVCLFVCFMLNAILKCDVMYVHILFNVIFLSFQSITEVVRINLISFRHLWPSLCSYYTLHQLLSWMALS